MKYQLQKVKQDNHELETELRGTRTGQLWNPYLKQRPSKRERRTKGSSLRSQGARKHVGDRATTTRTFHSCTRPQRPSTAVRPGFRGGVSSGCSPRLTLNLFITSGPTSFEMNLRHRRNRTRTDVSSWTSTSPKSRSSDKRFRVRPTNSSGRNRKRTR